MKFIKGETLEKAQAMAIEVTKDSQLPWAWVHLKQGQHGQNPSETIMGNKMPKGCPYDPDFWDKQNQAMPDFVTYQGELSDTHERSICSRCTNTLMCWTTGAPVGAFTPID